MDNLATTITEYIDDFFQNTGLNISPIIAEIIATIIVLLFSLLLGFIVFHIFERYLSKWAEKTKTTLDDEILKNIRIPIYIIVFMIGAYYSISPLSFLQPYENELSFIFLVFEILIITFAITRVVNVFVAWYGEKRAEKKKDVSVHILFLMRKIIQFIIYLAAFLLILAIGNIDLSGVVVGLGVGGIAIAFALQSVLSDVFSAFTIYFDKPFEIGDFVVLGGDSGTIKKIGVISTRIQTLQGEELIVSNNELISTRIRNFKKMKRRRISFRIGVTYDTPLKKLQKIPDIIRTAIEEIELAESDRIHFREYGDFSLNFEIVYYIRSKDYVKYMDIQQELNFKIKEAFEKEKIEMAFPTQTIFLNKEN